MKIMMFMVFICRGKLVWFGFRTIMLWPPALVIVKVLVCWVLTSRLVSMVTLCRSSKSLIVGKLVLSSVPRRVRLVFW